MSLLIAAPASTEIFSLQEFYIHYKDFHEGSREPLIDWQEGRVLDREMSAVFNIDVMKYGYFNNKILGLMDRRAKGGDSKFRLVGWNYRLGTRVTPWLSFEYEHFSKHIMDKAPPWKFPVTDSYGIKLYFYRRGDKKSLQDLFK